MTTPWPFAQWGLDIMGPFPCLMGTKHHGTLPDGSEATKVSGSWY